MSRTKAASILFIAAAALLGVFLVRDTADRAPEEKARIQGPAATAPETTSLPAGPSAQAPSVDRQGGSEAAAAVTGAAEQAPAALDEDRDENPHPGSRVTEATLRKLHGDSPLTADHPHMKSAIEIQERNNVWLMAHPAVVGTAVGLNDDGAVALIVYTKVEAPELPKAIEGLPVAPFRSGEFFARTRKQDARVAPVAPRRPGQGGGGGDTSTFDRTDRYRPSPIGISTGHPAITAGTIGCRVTDGTKVYALSNNHVYANENAADIGDNVLQPGDYDGGLDPADAIGTLADFQDILGGGVNNTMDAAIAEVNPADLLKSTPSNGYGTPDSAHLPAAVSMAVRKYGRTTGQTSAKVSAINGTVNVGYNFGVARFVGQIFITKGGFSAGGDSGSLIVKQSGSNPVGLLFAGSSSTTIANPIGPVLARFGVTVDGK